MADRQRVFITGVGAVSPLASGWQPTWEGLLAGRSGVRAIQRFEASTLPTRIGAQILDDVPVEGDPSEGDVSARAVRFALRSAQEAVADAGLEPLHLQGPEVGVFLGAGNGECLNNQALLVPLLAPELAGGEDEVPLARFYGRVREAYDARRTSWASPEAPASTLARTYGCRGPVRTSLTACAASAQAVGEAFRALSRGRIQRALAGGAHAMVHADGIMAFSKLGALSSRNDEPATASRPFDATRDGFVLGEGSAILVLETEEAARARGVTPLVEITGYGVTADGYRATDPEPEGARAAVAIQRSLEVAGRTPADVDYINAHGTSTQANDRIETVAYKRALGEDDARRVAISSVKSMLGHLVAAAGAMEAAATYQTLLSGQIPPTINYQTPDPFCDLDYVPNEAREAEVRVALSNSSGFGGQNVCLVFEKSQG